MEFSFQDTKSLHKIKVFGIGGAGNNAINNMISAGLKGPLFVAANSDLQDLELSKATHKVQVGTQLTKGLGCGGKPEIGRLAALEDIDRIKDMLADSDMVFITAGMGGGTGSGGAPVVAEALSKLNNPPLIVSVVTRPFPFEGPRRMQQADEAIKELMEYTHSIITVPNAKLLEIVPKGGTFKDAVRMADDVLLKAVQGITDLITGKGYMNVDFQDIKTIMTKRGPTIMGIGQATGADRALKAAQEAISSPLLDDLSISGAKGILINITASEESLGMDEVSVVGNLIQQEAHVDADIITGVAYDDSFHEDGMLRVTIIATGLTSEEDLLAEEEIAGEEIILEASTENLEDLDEDGENKRNVETVAAEPKGQKGKELNYPKRNRNLSRYENYQLDEETLDTPTYLRNKAN